MNHVIGIILLFISPVVLFFFTAVALYKMIRDPDVVLLDGYDMRAHDRKIKSHENKL